MFSQKIKQLLFCLLTISTVFGFSMGKYDETIIDNFLNEKIQTNGIQRAEKTINKLESTTPSSNKELINLLINKLSNLIIKARNTTLKREEVGDEYKWNKTKLFKSDKEFANSVQTFTDIIPQFEQYKGKLSDDNMLLGYLKLNDKVAQQDELHRLYTYIGNTTDNKNPQNSINTQLADNAYYKYQQATSFFGSEIKEFSDEKIDLIINNPQFADYKKTFESIKRSREHILTQEQENIISKLNGAKIPSESIYNDLLDVDIKFPEIKDPNGNSVLTNYANMYTAWNSSDREYRKEFTDKFYNTYLDYKTTLSDLVISNIKEITMLAKIKKYSSVLQMKYLNRDVDEKVYDNLLSTTKGNLSTFHRYRNIKKEYMGLDSIHYYDVFTSIQSDNSTYTFEEGKTYILSGLSILGQDYLNGIKEAFSNNWIDVYSSKDKTGGAFCATIYGFHPLILINYLNDMGSISTLAHELGHAMNNYFSQSKQPYPQYEIIYPVEIPSITNELLLFRAAANNAKDPTKKLYFLDKYLNTLNFNFGRAAMYADYEKQVYDLAREDEPINYETLDSIFEKLFKEYFGPDFSYDEYLKIERAIKPHFFSSYYTHEYAVSAAAANQIATKLINNENGFKEKYINYLAGGSTGTPRSRALELGIDIEKPDYIEEIFTTENQIMDEMEDLIRQIKQGKK